MHVTRFEESKNRVYIRSYCLDRNCQWKGTWVKLRITARRHGQDHVEQMKKEGK